MQLCNKYGKEELREMIMKEDGQRLTISFYQYHHLEDPIAFRNELFRVWDALKVKGRIYVADEGINAQLSVPEKYFEPFRDYLYSYSWLKGIRLNAAVQHKKDSFLKLTIKVKDKILADGLNDDTFDVTDKGKHLGAKEFNELISDPDTILIDMRNHYESEVGYFQGAIRPDVDSFRESLPIIEEEYLKGNEDKNIAMYCTGGIRCEKASAWFKHRGYANVHQLEGGIIKYTHDAKQQELPILYKGTNFVFDERKAERISDDVVSVCHQCGEPSDTHTNCANDACHLLFIQCSKCAEAMDSCCSTECKDIHALPVEEQKELRKGRSVSNLTFRKGRGEQLRYKR